MLGPMAVAIANLIENMFGLLIQEPVACGKVDYILNIAVVLGVSS
jgi:hypothetical protein